MRVFIAFVLLCISLSAKEIYMIQLSAAKNRNYLIDILKRFEGYGHNLKIIKKDNGFFALVADTGEDKTKAMTLLKRYKRDFDDAFLEKKKDADVSLNLSSLIKNTPKKENSIKLYILLPKKSNILKNSISLNGKKATPSLIEKNYMEFFFKNLDLKNSTVLSFDVNNHQKIPLEEIKISAFAKDEKGNVITLIDKMQKEKLKLSLEDYLQTKHFLKCKG